MTPFAAHQPAHHRPAVAARAPGIWYGLPLAFGLSAGMWGAGVAIVMAALHHV